jgi:hypothetical protein
VAELQDVKCATSPLRCPCWAGIHVKWSVQYKKCTCD